MLSFSLLSVLVTELNYLAESVYQCYPVKISLESSPLSQHEVYETVSLSISSNVIGKQQIFFLSKTANLVFSVCNRMEISILLVTSLNY